MDKDKAASALAQVAAEFINRESNRQSLITVTRVELDEQEPSVRIFVSVYPADAVRGALDFLNRNTPEFKRFVRARLKTRDIPRYEFAQDPLIGGLQVGSDEKIA